MGLGDGESASAQLPFPGAVSCSSPELLHSFSPGNQRGLEAADGQLAVETRQDLASPQVSFFPGVSSWKGGKDRIGCL